MSQSVERAVEILEFVAVQPRTQSEVAAHLDIHRSTALRVLQTLTDHGLTRKRADGKYGVGYRIAGLAHAARDQFDLANIARPYLIGLGEQCSHTVHLAQLDGGRIIYVDKIEQPGMIKLFSQIGAPVCLHTAGVSKAVLAFQEPAVVDAVLDGADFARHTATTITSRQQFDEELRVVAERGWSVDDAEYEDYVNCVAMPVRDASDRVVAAVSVTSLKGRADLAALQKLLPDLRAVTDNVSKELGWRP
ncbi:IclR family transcriptional regulator [Rhodococcus sp. BP-349]|uniref:IclR family transcriptional regulator n=1 Tax=unclassified Rhodococcus (in: high G+C Gram-positive bacteria) TaxID=192944 RepID=UPI001C9A9A8A|nr:MULTISPECIES: IclR family transcriptional regulator [unclassified Rhodococcus (in: high G+C Gram-positive bacteria)]MBY6539880.1 IclR family transcriptional regulator [Rhodococcus sp. BP-363]MBY6543792.1 IclR family transcriptional regulator [Rhodococcus sp. BP-369]MBY6563022.1 IclR family transcriptional regulator [Rhodococcus sp. BP-370]MBY6577314.1 IclR family transcriptional regulator [Rhodococcus sp. BP-364]MBY6586615.1 IclR family transcriptional regulator [Rhodococcus sp. BP-358]